MKKIPLNCLVVMIGPSKGGKTFLASNKFPKHEIISPRDVKHSLIGDKDHFDIYKVVNQEMIRRITLKLSLGERVVVDAANLKRKDRQAFVDVSESLGVPLYYIVVDRCIKDKIASQSYRKNDLLKHHEVFLSLEKEILRGDMKANIIDSRVEEFEVIVSPDSDLKEFIKSKGFKGITAVGDIHGMDESLKSAIEWASARNHFIVFLGDIVDYGPRPMECIELVYNIVTRGRGVLVMGNHERKILRWLDQYEAQDVRIKLSEGNKATTTVLSNLSNLEYKKISHKFRAIVHLSRHHWVASNTLFAHGAAEPEMFSINSCRLNGRLSSIALFGEVDNKIESEDGHPQSIYGWVDRIPNCKRVIVGHDIRSSFKPLTVKGSKGGEAVFMDTGSGKGGRLTSVDLVFDDAGLKIQNFTAH